MAPFWAMALGLAAVLPACAWAAGTESARIRQFESSLLPAFQVEGEPEQRWTLQERMAHWKVPGLSIAVIRDGKVAWTRAYGVLQAGKPEKVDAQTVFSVGSVSKMGAAATTLRLVDAGKLDLDKDVNGYITRWKVPESVETAISPVTLRGLLSHTAGLSVHGFPDFQPQDPVPTVIDTLEGRAPAKNVPVRVEYLPGSRSKYSGGGTTVEQLVIEDATGLGFAQAARRYVFEPLGMTRSTYENPLPASHGNIAKAHGRDGSPRALPRGYETMPEMAANGLWTTPGDVAKLVIAIIESYRGKPDSFLSTALAHRMLSEVWPSQVGLGPFLEGRGLERNFYHGGFNDSYKAHMEGHPNTGDGVVIMTNGELGYALISEVRRAVAVAEGWPEAFSPYERIRRVPLSPAELGEMAGFYVEDGEGGMKREVTYKDGSLWSAGFEMIPIDSDRFVMYSGGTKIHHARVLRGYDGRVIGMIREKDDGLGLLELRKVK